MGESPLFLFNVKELAVISEKEVELGLNYYGNVTYTGFLYLTCKGNQIGIFNEEVNATNFCAGDKYEDLLDDSSEDGDTKLIVGIIIIAVLFVLVIFFILFGYMQASKKARKERENAESEGNDEKQEETEML